MSELLDKIEGLDGPVPQKAEFYCAPYNDCSDHQIKIGYDTTSGHFSNHILIDDCVITFEEHHAEEVIAAIRHCAAALRAKEQST